MLYVLSSRAPNFQMAHMALSPFFGKCSKRSSTQPNRKQESVQQVHSGRGKGRRKGLSSPPVVEGLPTYKLNETTGGMP